MDQTRYEEYIKAEISQLTIANAPDWEIESLRREMKGGDCPECGEGYREVRSKNQFSDFRYYEPVCECLERRRGDHAVEESREKKLNAANIPAQYRKAKFDNWDYSVDEGTNESMRRVYEISRSEDFEGKNGVVMFGEVGTGKTHLSCALAQHMIFERHKTVKFIPMADIVGHFIRSNERNVRDIPMGAYECVVLDDMDKAVLQNEWVKERIFSLIDGIFRDERFVIGTMNAKSLTEIDAKFDLALSSRIFGNCHMVEFKGKDYRKYRRIREAQKEG